ncbi:MAG TPA: MFS transporter, partial [Desulfurococcaceae archaeon]|nr:MFS transporter [Desulfurococcaceae archaeon]
GSPKYSFFIFRYVLRGIASGMFGSIKYLYLDYIGMDKATIGTVASLSSIASSLGKVIAGTFSSKRKILSILVMNLVIAFAYFLLTFSPVLVVPTLLVMVSLLYGLEHIYSSSLMMKMFRNKFATVYSTTITLWSLSSSISTLVVGFIISRYGFRIILLIVSLVFLLLSLVAYRYREIDPVVKNQSRKRNTASSIYTRLKLAFSYRPYMLYEFSTLSMSLATSLSIPYVYIFLLKLSNSYEVVTLLASIHPILNLAITAIQPLIGKLADRFGSHRLLAFSFTLFSLYHLTLSQIIDAFQYLLCLALLSLAIPLNNISIMSFLHDILGSREKDIYLGVSGSLATLPSMIGPVVGGFIARALELRGVFLSSAIICAVSIVPLLGAKRLSISSR